MKSYKFDKKYVNKLYRVPLLIVVCLSVMFFIYYYGYIATFILIFIVSVVSSATVLLSILYISKLVSEIIVSGNTLKILFFDQRRHTLEIKTKDLLVIYDLEKITLKDKLNNVKIGIIPKKIVITEEMWEELVSYLKNNEGL